MVGNVVGSVVGNVVGSAVGSVVGNVVKKSVLGGNQLNKTIHLNLSKQS